MGKLGRALPVSTFGETNDATCWPNSPEFRSMLQQDQERSIRKRKIEFGPIFLEFRFLNAKNSFGVWTRNPHKYAHAYYLFTPMN